MSSPKRVVRLAVVQWRMQETVSTEAFLEQCETHVEAAVSSGADLLLFPELLVAPLLGRFGRDGTVAAMRSLAGCTPEIIDGLQQRAVERQINIVAGSLPTFDGEEVHNASFLLRRDGTRAQQTKLHLTPDESSCWSLSGGDGLRVFDTDVGRVGILICYDVEFPELGRVLRDQDMDLLLVPFWTDSRSGYLRVRRCAQARAVENECYVAISGSFGDLPQVENAETQYSQSAIFSPADFDFPADAIVAEASPNCVATLVADLELDKLEALRANGSVRNGRDRRLDLYRVEWRGGALGDDADSR